MSLRQEALVPAPQKSLPERFKERITTLTSRRRLKEIEKGVRDNDGTLHLFARGSGDPTNIWVSFRVNHLTYDSNQTPYVEAQHWEASTPLDRFGPRRPYWPVSELVPGLAQLAREGRISFVDPEQAEEFLNLEFEKIEPLAFACRLADIVGCAEVKRYWWYGSLGEDKQLSILEGVAQRTYLREKEEAPTGSMVIVKSLLKDPKGFGRYLWIAPAKPDSIDR